MKKHILYTTLLLAPALAIGQGDPGMMNSSNTRPVAMWMMPDVEKTETVQTRFRDQKWSPGTVQLRNDKVMRVPLIFDQYSNQLYYLQQGQIMEFDQPIKQFTMDLLEKNDTVSLLFRSGYPAVDFQTSDIFYQVMVEGKFQLLKCKAKTVYLKKEQELPEERRTYKRQLLYAYLPDGKMVQVKTEKDFVVSALYPHAKNIHTLIDDYKLNLKKESGVARLFILLNGEK